MAMANDQMPQCRALMGAVLKGAMRDARSKNKRLARRALDWMFSDAPHYVLEFPAVCGYLGLEPTAVRSQILREGQFPMWLLPPDMTLPDHLQ